MACASEEVPVLDSNHLIIDYLKPIGEGHYGLVHEGFIVSATASERGKTETKERVAVKLEKGHSGDIKKEAKRLLLLQHAYVIGVKGICEKDGNTVLVTEFMACDLLSKLHRLLISLPTMPKLARRDKFLLRLLINVNEGMDYLSRKGYVHRDLAARNILLTAMRLKDAIAKISDFGLARNMYDKQYYHVKNNRALPYKSCAPEILAAIPERTEPAYLSEEEKAQRERSLSPHVPYNPKHSVKSDVWAFGILIWEILMLGEVPFRGLTPEKVKEKVVTQEETLDIPETASAEITALMMETWEFDPDARPNFAEILEKLKNMNNLEDLTGEPATIISKRLSLRDRRSETLDKINL